jgi:16S rRNA (adenine1518-N6/adenine1519-N6)-dimethyltransferase
MPGKQRTRSRRRPALGQHFLKDSRIRGRIFELLVARDGDCWLEIGPGNGEMTLPLARAGRALTAVERDPQLATALQEQLSELATARVVEADILGFSLGEALRESPCARLRVYGNLPYYITSPILRHLFESIQLIEDIHVMVQREVAERLVAQPGTRDYGYLSVLTQFHVTAEILLAIPRGVFQPPPRVESALVLLTPLDPKEKPAVDDQNKFMELVSLCFHQKRKTLRNNLRGRYATAQVEAVLTTMGLSRLARAEELSLREFAQLYAGLEGA